MSARPILILFFILAVSLPVQAKADIVTISDVPAYYQGYGENDFGCGPAAAGAIIGFYDLNGYDNLFNVSGWDLVRQTDKVKEEISSSAHEAKYNSNPDDPDLEVPPDTSIADFFHTSEGSLEQGWSTVNYSDIVFMDYAGYRGYGDWYARYVSYGSEFGWSHFTAEIDAGRPMMFLVDSNKDGATDHFVPVFGYDTDSHSYAYYNNWSEGETIRWASFQGMSTDDAWGVGYATFITPGTPDPVPVPSSLLLLGFGVMGLAGLSRKNKPGLR